MKRVAVVLCLLLLTVLTTAPAFADLTGANVTVNYLFPDINSIFQVLGTGTVTNTGFTVNSFGQHNYTVFPTDITLTNVAGNDIFFTTASFNGYQLVVNSGGSPITGVTIGFSDVTGFDASRISFDAHDVWLNMQSLTTTPGLDIQLDLQFGQNNVPEPASLFLMGSGLIGIGGLARKRMKKA